MKARSRLLLAGLALALAGAPAQASPAAVSFPLGFGWGAATAAHQVEGHLTNDWNAFEATPGAIAHGDTSQVGVDFYHRFDADFALAEQMGQNAHRLSVEWARIEPTRGQWDAREVAHYHAVFASMRKHHLRPLVTLHHFTNPNWVAAQGGWLNPKTIDDFTHYAALMGREFGSDVDDWVTINEPNVYAFQGFDNGLWPPRHHDREEALRVMANLAHAHVAAYRALHATDRVSANHDGVNARVGIAQHIALFDPFNPWNPVDRAKAYFNDRVFNRAVLEAISTGRFDFWVPGVHGVHEVDPRAASALDFIGVNYYTRWLCTGFGPKERVATPGAPVTALGWEIYPDGLERSLLVADGYAKLPDGRHVPLLVTENGIDDPTGQTRSRYLVRHLQVLARAIAHGLPVRGYYHWTLADNFEWAEGYGAHFGLYSVDRRPGGHLARRATPSVAVFRAITAANGLTPRLLATLGDPSLSAP